MSNGYGRRRGRPSLRRAAVGRVRPSQLSVGEGEGGVPQTGSGSRKKACGLHAFLFGVAFSRLQNEKQVHAMAVGWEGTSPTHSRSKDWALRAQPHVGVILCEQIEEMEDHHH